MTSPRVDFNEERTSKVFLFGMVFSVYMVKISQCLKDHRDTISLKYSVFYSEVSQFFFLAQRVFCM